MSRVFVAGLGAVSPARWGVAALCEAFDLGNRVGICWPGNDLNTNMNRQPNLTRRQFLSTSALAATALSIVPRHVVAGSGEVPPSEKINIAGVGVGGQGAGDINEVAPGNNIVALCDVDLKHSAETFKRFPQAKQYRDFRKMFDEMEKSIEHCGGGDARPLPRRGGDGRHQTAQARLLRETAGPFHP